MNKQEIIDELLNQGFKTILDGSIPIVLVSSEKLGKSMLKLVRGHNYQGSIGYRILKEGE